MYSERERKAIWNTSTLFYLLYSSSCLHDSLWLAKLVDFINFREMLWCRLGPGINRMLFRSGSRSSDRVANGDTRRKARNTVHSVTSSLYNRPLSKLTQIKCRKITYLNYPYKSIYEESKNRTMTLTKLCPRADCGRRSTYRVLLITVCRLLWSAIVLAMHKITSKPLTQSGCHLCKPIC